MKPLKDMRPFPVAMLRTAIPKMLEMSDAQMSGQVRQRLAAAFDLPDHQLYDVLAEIANLPIIRVAPGVVIGEISGFVQAVCDVKRHYSRPLDLTAGPGE